MIRNAMILIFVPTALAAGLGCNSNPCSPEKMQGFFEVSPQQAIGAAKEFCDFPGSMGKLLEGASRVDPSQRAVMISSAVNDDMDLFERVCPNAETVFKEMGKVEGEQIKGWLYDQCGFARLGLLDRSEIEKTGFAEIWVGAMIYGWMAEKKVPEARRFARHLMALE